MFPSFECLPPEIQEIILSALPRESLLNASKVCRLWLELANRIAKNRYQHEVLPECVYEITRELSGDNEDTWLRVLNGHSFWRLLIENRASYRLLYTVEVNSLNKPVYYVQYGSQLFICQPTSTQSEEIKVYDAQMGDQPILFVNCQGGPIRQIQMVPMLEKLIVLSTMTEIYTIPNFKDKTYEMKKLKLNVENHPGELTNCRSVSVDGSSIAFQTSPSAISVFKMRIKNDDEVILDFVNNFEYCRTIYQFSFWMDEMLVLLETGQILQWHVGSREPFEYETYPEIRYRNPAWLFRGRIFCSTIISRALLGLWHLEAGTYYWLIGKPATKLVRHYSLDRNINGVFDEIRCICLRQKLLFCGTKGGKINIYCLSDALFEDPESANKECMMLEFTPEPELTIDVCERSIDSVSAQFADNNIYVVAKSTNIADSTAYFQYIVISKVFQPEPTS